MQIAIRMHSKFSLIMVAVILVILPMHAQAYIGPGLGLGVAATVLGLFLALILLLVGLIWMPIRRILRERKQYRQPQDADRLKQ